MKRYLPLSLLFATLLHAASNYRLGTGLVTTSYDYMETDASGVLDTERSDFGDILGGYARLEVTLWEHNYGGSDAIELYGSHTEGKTEYIGSEFGSGAPYGSETHSTENIFDDYRLSYLRHIERDPVEYTFSVGAGYYEWQRTLSTIQAETYHWFYSQLGGRMNYKFVNQWNLGATIAAHYAFEQAIDVEMPAFTGRLDLGKTYTLTAAVPLTIPISRSIHFAARIKYEFTKINHSNTLGGVFEPDSEQENLHLYLGLLFRY